MDIHEKYKAIMGMLANQRNAAMNDLALIAGELAEANHKIKELEDKLNQTSGDKPQNNEVKK